jgi:hypothetical protein
MGVATPPAGPSGRKTQTPSTKLQTNLKFQYSMTETGFEFGISVIVICLIFVICDLGFDLLQWCLSPAFSRPLPAAGCILLPP